MTTVRRSPWLNDRAAVLLARLREYDLNMPEATAREVISKHLDTTAQMMRISRQAAKFYVSDDVVTKMADRIMGRDRPESEDAGENTEAGEADVISIVQHRKRRP